MIILLSLSLITAIFIPIYITYKNTITNKTTQQKQNCKVYPSNNSTCPEGYSISSSKSDPNRKCCFSTNDYPDFNFPDFDYPNFDYPDFNYPDVNFYPKGTPSGSPSGTPSGSPSGTPTGSPSNSSIDDVKKNSYFSDTPSIKEEQPPEPSRLEQFIAVMKMLIFAIFVQPFSWLFSLGDNKPLSEKLTQFIDGVTNKPNSYKLSELLEESRNLQTESAMKQFLEKRAQQTIKKTLDDSSRKISSKLIENIATSFDKIKQVLSIDNTELSYLVKMTEEARTNILHYKLSTSIDNHIKVKTNNLVELVKKNVINDAVAKAVVEARELIAMTENLKNASMVEAYKPVITQNADLKTNKKLLDNIDTIYDNLFNDIINDSIRKSVDDLSIKNSSNNVIDNIVDDFFDKNKLPNIPDNKEAFKKIIRDLFNAEFEVNAKNMIQEALKTQISDEVAKAVDEAKRTDQLSITQYERRNAVVYDSVKNLDDISKKYTTDELEIINEASDAEKARLKTELGKYESNVKLKAEADMKILDLAKEKIKTGKFSQLSTKEKFMINLKGTPDEIKKFKKFEKIQKNINNLGLDEAIKTLDPQDFRFAFENIPEVENYIRRGVAEMSDVLRSVDAKTLLQAGLSYSQLAGLIAKGGLKKGKNAGSAIIKVFKNLGTLSVVGPYKLIMHVITQPEFLIAEGPLIIIDTLLDTLGGYDEWYRVAQETNSEGLIVAHCLISQGFCVLDPRFEDYIKKNPGKIYSLVKGMTTLGFSTILDQGNSDLPVIGNFKPSNPKCTPCGCEPEPSIWGAIGDALNPANWFK